MFSRAASFDIVVTMTITFALGFFLAAEIEQEKRYWFLAGFYGFVGLSLLAKGLIGIVIPFGVIGAFYVMRRRLPDRTVMRSVVWGVPLALAVAALWYGPVIARQRLALHRSVFHPTSLRAILFQQISAPTADLFLSAGDADAGFAMDAVSDREFDQSQRMAME